MKRRIGNDKKTFQWQNRSKLEVSDKVLEKLQNIWKLNYIFLTDSWVKGENIMNIKNTLNQMEKN